MSSAQDQQAIALAAMFQAASLVDQIANRGMVAQTSLETSVHSIFITNPPSTEDIFGGVSELPHNLNQGLRGLSDLLNKKRDRQLNQVTNYVLSLLLLQQKLSKHPEILSTLGERIEQLREKASYFSPDSDPEDASQFTHPNVISGLDALYQDTISTLSFRIQVHGDPRLLQNPENAAKSRALLLAGIRAAILWRQVGGRRWHLLVFKARLRQSVARILG